MGAEAVKAFGITETTFLYVTGPADEAHSKKAGPSQLQIREGKTSSTAAGMMYATCENKGAFWRRRSPAAQGRAASNPFVFRT
jgi:hypothetical protein